MAAARFWMCVVRRGLSGATRASGARAAWYLERILSLIEDDFVCRRRRRRRPRRQLFHMSDTPAELKSTRRTSSASSILLLRRRLPVDEFLSRADAAGSIAADIIAGSPRMITLCASLDGAARARCSRWRRSDSVVVVGARGSPALPAAKDDATATRSVYLGPAEGQGRRRAVRAAQPSASAEWAPVVSVRRQRDGKAGRAFSGQVFVECESEEKAAALLRYASRGGFDAEGEAAERLLRVAGLVDPRAEAEAQERRRRRRRRPVGRGRRQARARRRRPTASRRRARLRPQV